MPALMEWTFSLKEISRVASEFLQHTRDYKVFALHGQMGAGKTTFVHSICDILNVDSAVGSPTFSLVNEYDYMTEAGEKQVFHIDLYRIKDEEEALQAGIEDCLYSGAMCFVEWPEKAPGIFPPHTADVFISAENEGLRTLKLQYPEGNL
ncbi:tRNA (adenosine(37)-N6)-threonylcarbamoyltransferase complex ATPase subunit type 1 TsaE [Pollutibacter soli]|uniref:tRNA (adenosine(37)-N6)-threonylcarbamoyltransferase complex ATPase subunit type 1 TsaE n=1 Tax=Pollutibacter soli TaxID=3034157 RepID=UPI0030133376